jgi:transposase
MVFAKLQEKQVVRIKTEALSMDSTKPVVPPRSNCKKPWRYNKKIYKRRNGIERLFRRIKAFGRVCTRYEKLDVMYLAFLNLALIYDELK